MATTAKFYAYVNSVSTGTTVKLRSSLATQDHWGDSIDGSEADWGSTDDYDEGNLAISSTGWKSWTIDTSHLELGTGTSRIRLSDIYESDGSTRNVVFRTEEYTGTGSDPYLEIVVSADDTPQRCLTGMGT